MTTDLDNSELDDGDEQAFDPCSYFTWELIHRPQYVHALTYWIDRPHPVHETGDTHKCWCQPHVKMVCEHCEHWPPAQRSTCTHCGGFGAVLCPEPEHYAGLKPLMIIHDPGPEFITSDSRDCIV